MKLKFGILLLVCFGSSVACEEEIGSPCEPTTPEALCPVAPDPSDPEDDDAKLRQDIFYDACSKAFCMSTDGARPYCTQRCDGPLDCPTGFLCEATFLFPPLGCFNAPGALCEGEGVVPIKYCTAESKSVIDERDEAAGRDVWDQEQYDALQCDAE